MDRNITFKGTRVNLAGVFVSQGDTAPDFTVTSQKMEPATLGNFKGKTKVVTTFPSLDTPVCDLQVKEFNKKAAGFSKDIAVIGLSMDLPFAQKRFCELNDIKRVFVMSDYKNQSMCLNYGLLVKELHLIARSIIIVNSEDIIRYLQVVPEITDAPDYDSAILALEKILQGSPPAQTEKPYDFALNNWEEKQNVFHKEIRFKELKDLMLYARVLESFLPASTVEFIMYSSEKLAVVSVAGPDNLKLLSLIDRINI